MRNVAFVLFEAGFSSHLRHTTETPRKFEK